MYCKYCGKQIDNDSAYCMYCSKALSSPVEQKDHMPSVADENGHTRILYQVPEENNPRFGGTWKLFAYIPVGIWLLSIILVFVDWFSLEFPYSLDSIYYTSTVEKFSILDWSRVEYLMEEYFDYISYDYIDETLVVIAIIFAVFAVASVILLARQKRAFFFTGIAASSTAGFFAGNAIMLCYRDLKFTATPIIMLIINVVAIAMLIKGNITFKKEQK